MTQTNSADSRQKIRGSLDPYTRSGKEQVAIATILGLILYFASHNPNNTPPNNDVRSLHTAPQVVQTEPQDLNGDAKPNIPTDPDEITERQKVEKRTTIPNILNTAENQQPNTIRISQENTNTKIQ